MFPRRRRAPAVALLFTLTCVCVASCTPHAQDTLLIAGSSTMALYLEPVVKAFASKSPTASIVSEPGGATAGVIALKRQAIDVAMVARDVTADEDDDRLRDYLVARDGVAIVVSTSSPIAGLTMKQLADVSSGAVRSWKEVGGPDAPVAFIDRPKTFQLRKSFMDLVLGGEEPLRTSKVAEKQEQVLSALNADVNAISYVAFHRATADVKAVPINGVEMNRATMLSGRYPLTRSFYLAVYRHPSPLAERFITFALSKEGQGLLVEKGLLAVY